MTTQTYIGTLTIVYCANCSCPFGMPKELVDQRQSDHKSFYCPNGHSNYWPQESDKDRAQRLAGELDMERTRKAELARQLDFQTRATKTANTKLKNTNRRIRAGVCPCCHRTFKQLAAHMKNKHPEVV